MSSHPHHDPQLDIWKNLTTGAWIWRCWNCDEMGLSSDELTHAEALAAALNHCQKAGQP